MNTFWALILPSLANGYGIFLLKGCFEFQQLHTVPLVVASLVVAALPTLAVFIFCQNIILRKRLGVRNDLGSQLDISIGLHSTRCAA